ncbi:MAG TPA: CPBP family intramembrane glutamic endopeptidase [Candidatus Kapabacteria bacterium]|nr:CPBP family intramembrane glutamic endopeptidase [Candidatus Kapabacteria bacterium]
MTRPAFISRYPVATYFALVFIISWGGVLLVIGGPGAIPDTPERTTRLFPFALLAMLAGPFITGLLMTGLVQGRAGLREFRSRLLTWRAGLNRYAVALLTVPVLATAILLLLSIFSPGYLPDFVTTQGKGALLLTGLAMGVLAGLFEEPGWTGFAVPMLRRRYGIRTAGLIVGFLWGLWHFLVTFWASADGSGRFSIALLLPPLLFYVGVLPAYRVLMVWVHDRTGSLPIVMLMHASLTACTLFILKPAVTGMALSLYYLVLTAALWGVYVAIAAANGGQLARRSAREW